MKTHHCGWIPGACIVAAALVGLTACETDDDSVSADDRFSIVPSSATLGPADTVLVLTTEGGHQPLAWTVESTSLGSVTGTGSRVSYLRGTANGVNIVTCTDHLGWIATASINQVAASSGTNGTGTLSVWPTSASVPADSGTQVFTASGGSGTFTWALITTGGNHGQLSPLAGATTLYTSTDGGTDVIRLSDGATTNLITVTKR